MIQLQDQLEAKYQTDNQEENMKIQANIESVALKIWILQRTKPNLGEWNFLIFGVLGVIKEIERRKKENDRSNVYIERE